MSVHTFIYDKLFSKLNLPQTRFVLEAVYKQIHSCLLSENVSQINHQQQHL